ncbi:MAG: DUF819 family protein [Pseudomonadota bacterium]
MMNSALITNDAVVLGLLFAVLGLIFYSEKLPVFKKFYGVVPSLLLCYFIPGLLNTFGVIDGESSKLYFVSSRYLLPTILVLLTMSVDLSEIIKLGPKALIMFFTGTLGIILGGPVALLIGGWLFPDLIKGIGGDQLWRGLTTVAGSWIGGGANQASMKEVFQVGGSLFSLAVVVDILVANVWMAVLLILASRADRIDQRAGADTRALNQLKKKMEDFQLKNQKIPSTHHLMMIAAFAFACTGISHWVADTVAPFFKNQNPSLKKFSLTSSFFWLIVTATTIGLFASFSPIRRLESYGASKLGSVMLYVLIASIGMHMNVLEIFKHPSLFFIGLIWMGFHAFLILFVGRLIKAPLFYIAVGSQANVGGAASAPVVASCFHPSLAPVGVLLAVLGYVVGTYGAWLCGQLMRLVSQAV